MNGIEFDTAQTGFSAVLKDWQLKAMQVIWHTPEGANSRKVWQEVNKMLGRDTISRASIINFLNDMKELGVLDGDDRTGKGGHYLVYKLGMNEAEFKYFIASKMLESLMRGFPIETRVTLDKIRLETQF